MTPTPRTALLARIPALLAQHAGHKPWGGNSGSLVDVLQAWQLNPTDFMESLLNWGYTIAIEAQAAAPDALREALEHLLKTLGKYEAAWMTSRGGYGEVSEAKSEARAALAATPATLPADDTRIVWKRDHGMVIVTGDEEPQSLEIPAWAVRTIFDVAGKDPEEEARKVSAFINAHTGLDEARLAPSVYAQGHGQPDHCAEHGDIPGTQSMVWHVREAHGLTQEQWYTLEEADRIRGVQPFDPHAVHDHAAPDPLVTYTDPAGGPDWEPREDEA